MVDFRAVTFSGAVYEYRGSILSVESKRSLGSTVFKPLYMKSAKDPVTMPWDVADGLTPWHDVDKPVVGERFYAAGLSEWRISTEIVSVKELEPEEDNNSDDYL